MSNLSAFSLSADCATRVLLVMRRARGEHLTIGSSFLIREKGGSDFDFQSGSSENDKIRSRAHLTSESDLVSQATKSCSIRRG